MKYKRDIQILKENLDRFNNTPLAVRTLQRQFMSLHNARLSWLHRRALNKLLKVFNQKFFAPRGWTIRFTNCGIMAINSTAKLQ